MLRCITNITITQNATKDFPKRKLVLYFDFVNAFEAESNWKNLTNKGSLSLPKKIYYRDYYSNKLLPLDKNLGGFSGPDPYFLKGDGIEIAYGYKYFNKAGNEVTSVTSCFKGFVVKVGAKTPFTLDLEDNMYILKQKPAPTKLFKKTIPLKTIITELVAGTGFTVKCIGDNFIGDFNTSSTETVAQVLEKLRKDYRLESYFRGNELRVGILVYDEEEALKREKQQKKKFTFSGVAANIISDELEYSRKDDVKLCAKCYSINKKELETTTRDGKNKTKNERIEVVVGVEGGESRTLYFWNVTSKDKLKELGEAELKKYFYDGFRGSFTTFAIPFVQSGDNIELVDPVLPERGGRYRVKDVEYSGGVDGQRQKITIDYKLP